MSSMIPMAQARQEMLREKRSRLKQTMSEWVFCLGYTSLFGAFPFAGVYPAEGTVAVFMVISGLAMVVATMPLAEEEGSDEVADAS